MVACEFWENYQGHSCLKDLLRENKKLQSFSNGGIVVENKKLEEKISTYYKFKFPVTIKIDDMQLIQNTGFNEQ